MKMPFSASSGAENVFYQDIRSLYQAYMPYIKGGGLFVASRDHKYRLGDDIFIMLRLPKEEKVGIKGKICWISPKSIQSGKPAGFGFQILENEHDIQSKIEKLLVGMLNTDQVTKTF